MRLLRERAFQAFLDDQRRVSEEEQAARVAELEEALAEARVMKAKAQAVEIAAVARAEKAEASLAGFLGSESTRRAEAAERELGYVLSVVARLCLKNTSFFGGLQNDVVRSLLRPVMDELRKEAV